MRSDSRDLLQERVDAPLHRRDFLSRNVSRVGAEAARFVLRMQGNLLPAAVEDPPPRTQLSSKRLVRDPIPEPLE